jgi:LacI family transcriptional regulator
MGTKRAPAKRKTKQVTIKEVASHAKVSVATVSRVLNNNRMVKGHLRKAVQDAIGELKYEYKPSSLVPGRADALYRIGLVVPTIVNPFHALLLKGISSAALIHHVELVLLNSEENLDTERQHIKRVLTGNMQGVIYIPFAQQIDPEVIELIEGGFPLVFLDRVLDRDDICTVSSDNVEGAYQAATYLLNLGHREIAYVSGSPHLSTSGARFEGYSRGLKEVGLPVRDELILRGDTTFEKSRAEMLRFLKGGGRCTAVFASNDLMAFGVWEAAEEMGLRIPEDLSIIGYDEIPFSAYRSLTTISQPSLEIGRNTLMLLVDLIEGRRSPPQRLLLRDSLIIRKSCRKIL